MLKLISRLLLVGSCLLALAACSEILPGLNINTDTSHGQNSYRIIKDSHGKYTVEPTNADGTVHPEYRLLPITPGLVLAEQQAKDKSAANSALPPLKPAAVPPEYKIGPGDVINATVWDHPELNSPAGTQNLNSTFNGALVASDGTIYYPYVGTFKAAGMTTAELRSYLTDHLKTYIKDPQVDVRVISYQADRVEVSGEVAKPGTITLDNTAKGVLQAIDLSGGLTGSASRRRAILIRDGKRYDIDLAGLLSGDRVVANPVLEPGDEIHIPDQSGDQVFMLGAVSKQAPIVLQQNPLTLLQALTVAGGLDINTANDSGVLVFRLSQYSDQPPTVFTLDLSRAANVFLAGQFQLQPRDVIYVKATAFSKYNQIINQLLPTVTTVFELNQLTK